MDTGGRNKKYYSSNNYRSGGGGRGGGAGGGKGGKYRDDEISNGNNNNNNGKQEKDLSSPTTNDDKLSIPAPKTKGGRGGGNNNNNSHGNNHKSDKFNKKGSSKAGSRSTTPPPESTTKRGAASTTSSSTAASTAKSAKASKYEKANKASAAEHAKESARSSSSTKHGKDHHHKDPNAAAIEDAIQNAFSFPANPPTIDDISSAVQPGSPSIGRQAGNNIVPNVVTHASRILDPGSVFPRTPFIAVGDITSGSILRNHINMMNTAVNGTYDKTTTASPKFAHYSALTLMEQEPQNSSIINGYQTQVYRSSNRFSGSLVCIRRVVSCPGITSERCTAVSDYLRQFRHPNLAQLNSVIATTEFSLGSHDVLLEYRFVKGARSLQEIANNREELTEASIWSIASQLLSLVRHFHESEVPLRGLHISKLLLVQDCGDGLPSNNGGSQRVIFTGLGLVDVLGTTDVPPMSNSVPQLLRNDIAAVGNILYHLMTASLNMDKGAHIQASPMFTPALFALVRACREGTSAVNLCRALGERMSMELGTALSHSDYLLNEYQKEIHNGRLMKLLMRLNFAYCANQPYQDYDTLFIVRLFYQYLFAQVDEHGSPQFDWGLVYHGLNKLDIGSDDLVQLVSEQDHTLFVVSYKDVNRCIDVLCDGMLTGGRNSATSPGGLQGHQQGNTGAANNGLGMGLGGGGMMDGIHNNSNSHHHGGHQQHTSHQHHSQGHHQHTTSGSNLGSNPPPPPPPPPPRSSGMANTGQQQNGLNNNNGLNGMGNNNNGLQNQYGGGASQQQQYGGGMNNQQQYGNNNGMMNNNNNMYGGGNAYGATPISSQPGGGMRPF